MVEWLDRTMNDMAKRKTVPILFTDLNGALLQQDDDRVGGPHSAGKESTASKMVRPLLSGWSLSAASTFFL